MGEVVYLFENLTVIFGVPLIPPSLFQIYGQNFPITFLAPSGYRQPGCGKKQFEMCLAKYI
jgi:hypothetical protein